MKCRNFGTVEFIMIFKIDTHVHSEKSFDSKQSLKEIAAACKKNGIDGVCICDHNISFTDPCEIDGVMIMSGIEISTEYGHLLGLFIKSEVKPIRSFDEAVARIKDAGGIAVLAHPYENGKITKDYIDKRINDIVYMLDGIEAVNSRATQYVKQANKYALDAANLHGKPRFAGSDAHLPCEIGSSYAEIEADERTFDAVCEGLLKNTAKLYTKGTVRRINVVKSQYIKLKKSGFKPKNTYKFALRAIKGIVYELLRPEKREMREFN